MQTEYYRNFEYTLADQEIREIFAYGRFLTILSNSISIDPKVSINGQAAQPIPSGIGIELPLGEKPYTTLMFQNTSGGAMTIRFAISNGRIIDNRLVLSGTILTQDNSVIAELQGATTALDTGTQVTLSAEGLILAANASRKACSIHNPVGNNTLYLKLDPATAVTAANCAMALTGGSTMIFDDYRGAIRGLMATSGQSCQRAEW